jgi:hypothetical protein
LEDTNHEQSFTPFITEATGNHRSTALNNNQHKYENLPGIITFKTKQTYYHGEEIFGTSVIKLQT